MKSNVCKIEKGTQDLAAILKESEKVAVYNELTHKQSLQLRLICEEIDGMLPNIIDDFSGDLWFEFEDGVCKVRISLRYEEFTMEKKAELVSIAKNKKNSAAVGIVGKIRSALENFILEEAPNVGDAVMSSTFYHFSDYDEHTDYLERWSLGEYVNTVKSENKSEAWDELERSVIASVADDVIVGVKGRRADITIVKRF